MKANNRNGQVFEHQDSPSPIKKKLGEQLAMNLKEMKWKIPMRLFGAEVRSPLVSNLLIGESILFSNLAFDRSLIGVQTND